MAQWTDEQLDTLRQLSSVGLSAAEIAAVLGVTRNAVIGKRNRLGLSTARPASKRKAGLRQTQAKPEPAAKPKPTEPRSGKGTMGVSAAQKSLVRPREVTSGVILSEKPRSACAWILGDPAGDPDPMCCGAATVDGTWCADHRARVYRTETSAATTVDVPEAEAA